MELEPGGPHLTYCTNIHPGSGWAEVLANLARHAPELKRRLAPGRAFGLGLRLSAAEARQLLEGDRLAELRAFLGEHGLSVALLNGFVHGNFHREVVKTAAFAPDWRHEARVAYTLDLLAVLAALLPAGLDGGISTAPISYKGWLAAGDEEGHALTVRNLVRVTEALVRLARDEGRLVHLDLEPEPGGLVENSAELADYVRRWLLPHGAPRLAARLGVGRAAAEELLLEHVRVCLDTCHAAVEHESPEATWRTLQDAGLRVGRLQVSSALRLALPDDPQQRLRLGERLRPFADSTYLHQVVEERRGELRPFADLPDALATAGRPGARSWRVHFHVPLFVDRYGELHSTRAVTRQFLRDAVERRLTTHLEIETYTWDVLPGPLKEDLVESICREYRWVLGELGRSSPPPQPPPARGEGASAAASS
jgi:sugar phosphate isomerase/epimerase